MSGWRAWLRVTSRGVSMPGRFRPWLRDHVIELGSLPREETAQFIAFRNSLLLAGGLLNVGMVFGLVGYMFGLGAMLSGNPALGQLLLAGTCLWAGGTAAAGVKAVTQFAALMAHKPELPQKPHPVTRSVGRTWLPLAAGAAVALGTSFAMAAQLKPPSGPVGGTVAVLAKPAVGIKPAP